MFYIGKLITVFLHPITWVVLFFIYAVNRKKAIAKKYYYLLGILVFLASNKVFVNQLGLGLENHRQTQVSHMPKTAVVLGGYCSWDTDRKTIVFHEAADRLYKAIYLYKTGKINAILLSGGTVFSSAKRKPEALIAKDYLMEMGINQEHILVDRKSQSTYQNAVNSAGMLKSKGINKITLITSAFHMRRAYGCFKKQGIEVVPYATNYQTTKPGSFMWYDYIVPSTKALMQFDAFVKEWVGLVAYTLTGKI